MLQQNEMCGLSSAYADHEDIRCQCEPPVYSVKKIDAEKMHARTEDAPARHRSCGTDEAAVRTPCELFCIQTKKRKGESAVLQMLCDALHASREESLWLLHTR